MLAKKSNLDIKVHKNWIKKQILNEWESQAEQTPQLDGITRYRLMLRSGLEPMGNGLYSEDTEVNLNESNSDKLERFSKEIENKKFELSTKSDDSTKNE